ncbi:MAG: 4-hydroxy-tetrahydrodipicolinate synthase [Bacillota bacterium]
MEFNGLYTAMITPFTQNDEVDYERLEKNVEYQIENGVDGLLALGTTGEPPTLSSDEKDKIIDLVIEKANKRVPVMVGTGSNSTKKTIKNTLEAQNKGADIALIVTPYYNKPTQEGIFKHFNKIVKNTNIPIVVYNIESRTGRNIETSTLKRIANLNNIIGVKEASGNINQIQDVLNQINKPNFNLLSGDDSLTLPMMSLGAKGVVSVISNLYVKEMAQMVKACKNNDIKKARQIHNKLIPIMRGAFIETNPAPIKEAMSIKNMDTGKVRLPLTQLQDDNKLIIQEIIGG